MADISIIQANVVDDGATYPNYPVSITSSKLAGVALVPGDLVYGDTASLWQKLQCASSGGTATLSGYGANGIGVVLNTSAAGQPVSVQTSGAIDIGGNPAPAAGTVLYGSVNAGKIATSVTTGQYVTIIGQTVDSSDFVISPNATNVVHG